jgi:cholesterol oxidase
MKNDNAHYDFIIIGSGFGGAVSALRLTEKGYRVLVLEKGDRFDSKDFPETNWNLRKYLWLPALGWRGFFSINRFRHLAVLSGAGLGGGSLVYAGTLAIPDDPFFSEGSWAPLADWKNELLPFYEKANKMLGGTSNPGFRDADLVLKTLAGKIGREESHQPVKASAFFGEPEITVADPYFDGAGPDRSGCRFCGGCMVGCRYNAKNSLDKNYLYLAEQNGAVIMTGSTAREVIPLDPEGKSGYRVTWRQGDREKGRQGDRERDGSFTAGAVVLAAGVLGTVELLLRMKSSHLPYLSEKTGKDIRTNNESLIGVVSHDNQYNFSEGLAIGSILNLGDHVHVEPVRYSDGSDFMRALSLPMKNGKNLPTRLLKVFGDFLFHPIDNLRILFKPNMARSTVILLIMQQKDITLEFIRGKRGLQTIINGKEIPSAFIPEAEPVANEFARLVKGKPLVLAHETLFGTPTTAHIFGGAVMGSSPEEGVTNAQNRVFGYQNMYVCDGSVISSNPGVNPSLTIAAVAERAMSFIPEKSAEC